jgi:hypothetical protein
MTEDRRAPYTWVPTREYVANANVTRLARVHGIGSIAELRARSVADIGWYWDAAVRDLGLPFRTPYTQVVDLSAGIEHPDWFTGGELNVVDACLTRWAQATPGHLACTWLCGRSGHLLHTAGPTRLPGAHASSGCLLDPFGDVGVGIGCRCAAASSPMQHIFACRSGLSGSLPDNQRHRHAPDRHTGRGSRAHPGPSYRVSAPHYSYSLQAQWRSHATDESDR